MLAHFIEFHISVRLVLTSKKDKMHYRINSHSNCPVEWNAAGSSLWPALLMHVQKSVDMSVAACWSPVKWSLFMPSSRIQGLVTPIHTALKVVSRLTACDYLLRNSELPQGVHTACGYPKKKQPVIM